MMGLKIKGGAHLRLKDEAWRLSEAVNIVNKFDMAMATMT